MRKSRQETITEKINNMVLHGWIFDDLELKGNEALVYAALYATRSMKIRVSESEMIYRHLRISSSSFYNIKADLYLRGIVDVTDEAKEKYYWVEDPVGDLQEKRGRIVERYEQNSMAWANLSEAEAPSQIEFFGAQGQAASMGNAEKENSPAPHVDKNTAPAVDSVSDTPLNPAPRGQAPEEKHSQTDASVPLVFEPGHMTKEIFCAKWEVEYDGTEDTSGLNWDRLDYEFGRSKDLQKNPQARNLGNIIKYQKLICGGKLSDVAIAKRKEAKEKMEAQAAAAEHPERQDT